MEQGSENAEYEGGSSSAVAPFCFEEDLVQCKAVAPFCFEEALVQCK